MIWTALEAGNERDGAAVAGKRDASQPDSPGSGTARLTPRQAEVLRLAARGMNNKEIARYLGKPRSTIYSYFAAARERTGARTQDELVACAAAAGALAPDPPPSSRKARPPGPGRVRRDETPFMIPGQRDETAQVSSQCRVCGRPVTAAGTGRPRRYCSRACQARAYRARRRAASSP